MSAHSPFDVTPGPDVPATPCVRCGRPGQLCGVILGGRTLSAISCPSCWEEFVAVSSAAWNAEHPDRPAQRRPGPPPTPTRSEIPR